jgi:predicted MFS family arabinose efflux permease
VPLIAVTQRFSRKSLVIFVLFVFIVANLIAAVAPNFAILAVARVLGGMCHALFWSVVGAYAGHLVPKNQIARSISIVGGGSTAAAVLGIPLGTALGLAVGWRVSFAVIAGLVLIVIALVWRFVPPVDHRPPLTTGEIALPLHREKNAPELLTIVVLLALLTIGHFEFYAYIAPYLIGASGFPIPAVVPLLFVFGIAGAIGLALSPIIVHRYPRSGFIVTVSLVIAGVLAIGIAPHVLWVLVPGLILWGLAFGIAPVIIQTKSLVLTTVRTRDAMSAYMNTAYNFGIGGGAFLGGLALDHLGILSLPFVNAGLLTACVILVIITNAMRNKRSPRLT